ncbi:hypothetical protein L9F63_027960, partial [Diploptera punctata]
PALYTAACINIHSEEQCEEQWPALYTVTVKNSGSTFGKTPFLRPALYTAVKNTVENMVVFGKTPFLGLLIIQHMKNMACIIYSSWKNMVDFGRRPFIGLPISQENSALYTVKTWLHIYSSEVACIIYSSEEQWPALYTAVKNSVVVISGNTPFLRPTLYTAVKNSVKNSAVKNVVVLLGRRPFLACIIYRSEEQCVKNSVSTPCPWICELTNDAGYVVYSALGSFYLPMFVMLFSTGVYTELLFDEQRLTLRIHRGRGSSVMRHGPHSQQQTNTDTMPVKSPECQRLTRSSTRRSATAKPIKISVSYPSSDAICMSTTTTTVATNNNGGVPPPSSSPSPNSSKKSSFSSSSPPPPIYSVHYSNGNREKQLLATHNRRGSSIRRRSSTDSTLAPGANQQLLEEKDLSPSPTFDDSNAANKPKLISRMGKRNIKAQVKRFRMETKAAKTLGIIVGGFIVCWLPFFTMYLVRAFCEDCIHHLVFSILFWLGYCNSAINPCIYALFSKDFRFAFKRIICRCLCAKKKKAPWIFVCSDVTKRKMFGEFSMSDWHTN